MESQKEIYQALLDGKTLIHKNGRTKVSINEKISFAFADPQDWKIYDEWEMEPADWVIINTGRVYFEYSDGISTPQKFGMKYHTEKLAEKARGEMKEANLLRYWASVIDPEWEADWEDIEQEKWHIYFSNRKYIFDCAYSSKQIGLIYMSEEAAEKICKALNNGELKLS